MYNCFGCRLLYVQQLIRHTFAESACLNEKKRAGSRNGDAPRGCLWRLSKPKQLTPCLKKTSANIRSPKKDCPRTEVFSAQSASNVATRRSREQGLVSTFILGNATRSMERQAILSFRALAVELWTLLLAQMAMSCLIRSCAHDRCQYESLHPLLFGLAAPKRRRALFRNASKE